MGCLFIQQTMKMSLGLDQNGAVIVWQLVEVMHCFWGLAMKHSGLELGVIGQKKTHINLFVRALYDLKLFLDSLDIRFKR